MARPPTVTREATSHWTLAWQGRLADRVPIPVWLGLLGKMLGWCARRPVLTLAWAAVVTAWLRWGLLAGFLLGAVLVGLHRIVSSPGVAASGRVGRAYRSCQARGRLRRAWPGLAAEAGLVGSDGRPLPRGRIRVTDTAASFVVRNGSRGKTADDVRKAVPVLRAQLNADSVRARELTPSTTSLHIFFTDPLRALIRLEDLPRVTTRSRVALGLSELGQPLLLNLTMSLLLLGLPRSGKSSIIWVILDGIQRWTDQPVPELYVIDLKEGVELGSLDPAAGGIATAYVEDPGQAERMIHQLADEGHARLRLMKQHGWRKWTPERAGVLGPRKILLIDEFLALPTKVLDTRKDAPLKTILFKLPAAGITVIGASQLSQVDEGALGRLRNFFQVKLLLAAESQGIVQAAGGSTAVVEAPAHKLRLPDHAGRFYIAEEGETGWRLGKAAYVNDEDGEHLPIAQGLVDEGVVA